MNIFLTSLMHPSTAKNYSNVLSTFELTARSICSQTDQNFLFVVVCCEIPNINFQHKNIVYRVVDYPAADKNALTSKRLDKAVKIVSGLLFIEKYKPTFVYICDADDWISINVNQFLEQNSTTFGFYSDSGYLVDINNKEYIKKYGLHRFSGSSFAINYQKLMSALKFQEQLNDKSSKEHILTHVSESILLGLINSHRYLEFFKALGYSFKPFPFPSLIWIRNTGNNNLGDEGSVKGLHLKASILAEFGLSSFVKLNENVSNSLSRYLTSYKLTLISLVGSLINLRHKKK